MRRPPYAVRAPGRRRLPAAVASGALALLGVVCIAFTAAHQDRLVQPALDRPSAAAGRALADEPALAVPAGGMPTPAVVGPVLPRSEPRTLVIPTLGLTTPLLSLGQTKAGALQVPARGKDYDKAGWYRYSPTPGEQGPAVIAGHVDSAADGPSVFFGLGGLKPGAKILITRADGEVAVFAVDEVRRYRKRAFPVAVVYGNTPHAALRLITCGGDFDPDTRHYLDNIVVMASLVGTGGSA